MKNSEHLFFLIKSLSKAEKRSFKLSAKSNVNNGENNYTLLFDAIDRMNTYDHEVLVKKLKGKIRTDNISTLKVQLNNMILKSLRANNTMDDPRAELRKYMDYLYILYEKGLYSQCKKLLNKVKSLARDTGDYLSLDGLSILEFHIALKEANAEDLREYVDVTYPEVKEARKTNDILAEFEYLTVKMRLLTLESTSVGGSLSPERFAPIIEHPIMNLPIEEYPLQCQIDYHTIWGHYHYTMKHPQKAYFHRKKALELQEQTSLGMRYWLTHARFLLVCLTTYKMFDEFDKELEHIMTVINKTPASKRSDTFEAELNTTLYNIRFHRDLDEGNFARIAEYIDELEAHFSNAVHQIDTNLKMALFFNLSYAYLGNGEYKRALKWVNELLNTPEMRNLREDIHAHARVVNICTHYSLGNYDLIPSLVKSTQRYLKGKNRHTLILSSFLRFANRYFTEPYTDRLKEVFQKEQESWEELLVQDGDSQTSIDYVDLISWLGSVHSGENMESILKNRAVRSN